MSKKTKLAALLLIAGLTCITGLRAHELSARGYVGPGLFTTYDYNYLIGGLIIEDRDCPKDNYGHEQPVTFVIRVLGPSLEAHGVKNFLADPKLTFYDNLGRNLGGESNYLEVVLVVKLLPGIYTAVVEGQNGSTGIALLEAYKL